MKKERKKEREKDIDNDNSNTTKNNNNNNGNNIDNDNKNNNDDNDDAWILSPHGSPLRVFPSRSMKIFPLISGSPTHFLYRRQIQHYFF